MKINPLFLLLLCCGFYNSAFSQWAPAPQPASHVLLPGPVNGDTLVLAAGTPWSQFFRSTDGGEHWTDIGGPSAGQYFPAKAVRNKIFAFDSNNGISVYENGQWQAHNTGLQTFLGAYLIYSFDEYAGRLLCTGVFNNFNWPYTSTDDGLHWQPVSTSGIAAGFDAIYANFVGSRMYAWGINEINGFAPAAYFSDDFGQTWAGLPVAGPPGQLNFIAFNQAQGKVLYRGSGNWFLHQADSSLAVSGLAVSGNNISWWVIEGNRMMLQDKADIWRSEDGGLTWTLSAPGPIGVLAHGSMLVGLDQYNTVVASADFGQTWAQLGGSEYFGSIPAIMSNGDKVFLATFGKGGFYRYDPVLGHWDIRDVGLNKTTAWLNQMVVDGPKAWIYSWNGSYFTPDDGQNWSEIPVYLRDVVKIGGQYFAQDGFVKTSLDGENWSKLPAQPSDPTNLSKLFENDGKLYASTFDNLLTESTDAGQTWDTINNAAPVINSFSADNSNWYATASDGLYHSTDKGRNWSPIGSFSNFPTALFPFKGRVFVADYNITGIRYTDNNGQNWKVAIGTSNFQLDPIGNSGSGIAASGDVLVATAASGQSLVSVNKGANWLNFSTGLPSRANCSETRIWGDWIYALSDIGLFRRPVSDLPDVVSVAEPLFEHYPPAPNPTRGVFFLKNLPAGKRCAVEISDATGRPVFSGEISGGDAALDLSAQSPGLYFLKIFDGSKWLTGKIARQ